MSLLKKTTDFPFFVFPYFWVLALSTLLHGSKERDVCWVHIGDLGSFRGEENWICRPFPMDSDPPPTQLRWFLPAKHSESGREYKFNSIHKVITTWPTTTPVWFVFTKDINCTVEMVTCLHTHSTLSSFRKVPFPLISYVWHDSTCKYVTNVKWFALPKLHCHCASSLPLFTK